MERRHFPAFTDHNSLVCAMVNTTKTYSARQQYHLAFSSKFKTDIQHLPVKDNVVTECLSRSTANTVSLGMYYTAMTVTQLDAEDVQSDSTAITNLLLNNIHVYSNGPDLLCDISTGLPRPVIPSVYGRQVLCTI